jgi:hypothetical protein
MSNKFKQLQKEKEINLKEKAKKAKAGARGNLKDQKEAEEQMAISQQPTHLLQHTTLQNRQIGNGIAH